MPLALALDLGTTSIAAVAVDQRGRLVGLVRRPHGANVQGLPERCAEQNPQTIWHTALAVLDDLALSCLNETPVCLGLTGQMHSVLALDERGEPLTNLITWQDRRANLPSAQGTGTCLEEILSRCDHQAIHNTGCRLSPGYAAVTLSLLRDQDELPAKTSSVSLLADWIAAKLTGGQLVTERSNAASTGVFDLQAGEWNDELIAATGLERSWFPPVVRAPAQFGRLSESIANLIHLPANLPVMVPIGDNQASVLGSVPQGEPAIQITIGTGGQINWPIESFVRVEGMDTRPLPPDRLMLVGAGTVGGDAFAWVDRTVRGWLSTFGHDFSEGEMYARLLQLAGDVPAGADGLVCEPYFRGTRQLPLRRGSLTGIGTDNMTPGHLARAVLEGIAGSLHEYWTKSSYRPDGVAQIIGCGNGLEQNPLLREILSDRFGLPVRLPKSGEAAACGAALLAGVGTGIWPDLSTAGTTIQLQESKGPS